MRGKKRAGEAHKLSLELQYSMLRLALKHQYVGKLISLDRFGLRIELQPVSSTVSLTTIAPAHLAAPMGILPNFANLIASKG